MYHVLVEGQRGQIWTWFAKTTSESWPIQLKMLDGRKYESGQNDQKTLPYVNRILERLDPNSVCRSHLRKLANLQKMSIVRKYESGQNDPKTLPQVGRRLEMLYLRLCCGNDHQILTDRAKNVSWQIVVITIFKPYWKTTKLGESFYLFS